MALGKRFLSFVASVSFLLVVTIHIHKFYIPFQSDNAEMSLLSTKTDIKYILVWNMEETLHMENSWSMEKSYKWSLGRERFIGEGCEENRCKITKNRTEKPIDSFDAILFHQRAFRWNDVPQLRNKTQRYVHWMNEAPLHLHYDKTSLKTMDNFFNWTFTYRHSSTFFSPYGVINVIKQMGNHPSGASLDSYISNFGAKNSHLGKSKNSSVSIAWFVSNCNSQSNRESLVKKLQSFIKVDVYGGCGPLDCAKSNNCFNMVEKKYKFYLSLENAVCQDYLTEKFFSIAQYNVIPVVLNGVEMNKFAPPHSHINVLDFKTVKDLADYLLLLSENDEMYASYFWWKRFYSVRSGYLVEGYCNVCKALHETTEDKIDEGRIEAPSSMYKWWVDTYTPGYYYKYRIQ